MTWHMWLHSLFTSFTFLEVETHFDLRCRRPNFFVSMILCSALRAIWMWGISKSMSGWPDACRAMWSLRPGFLDRFLIVLSWRVLKIVFFARIVASWIFKTELFKADFQTYNFQQFTNPLVLQLQRIWQLPRQSLPLCTARTWGINSQATDTPCKTCYRGVLCLTYPAAVTGIFSQTRWKAPVVTLNLLGLWNLPCS